MTRKKRDSISSHAFRVRYLRRSREIWRRYLEAKPWIRQMHTSVLKLKPRMRIVDMGCGTGDFTRYLAELVSGNCDIIGVDNRSSSLRAAKSETMKADLARNISYRKGDAYKIPVIDSWADLTCCRTVLMHLAEPLRAVREMVRVTRTGGMVAAFEQSNLSLLYVPEDESLKELAHELSEAYANGIKKLEGKDYAIGPKLPFIFGQAGLKEITAELQADVYLSCDPRRKLDDVRAELEFYLAFYNETRKIEAKTMLAGGASKQKIDLYNRWFEKWAKSLLADNQKLRSDTSFHAGGLILVAGQKT